VIDQNDWGDKGVVQLDRLIKVRQDASLRESVSNAGGEVVERQRLIRMTRGTKE
jgi:hypothetical protein